MKSNHKAGLHRACEELGDESRLHGARYYDPATGHFLSADPSALTAGNPFKFNGHGYAKNNPVLNVDPNGRETGRAYAAIRRAEDGVPQPCISPDDKVGPAIEAGLGRAKTPKCFAATATMQSDKTQ